MAMGILVCLQEEFYCSGAVAREIPILMDTGNAVCTGIPKVDVPVIRHQASFSCRKVDQ